MNETPTVEELQAYVANLKQGAAIIYSVMNRVYALHDATEDEQCSHCQVAYPCETVKVLLEEMIPIEEPEEASPQDSEDESVEPA